MPDTALRKTLGLLATGLATSYRCWLGSPRGNRLHRGVYGWAVATMTERVLKSRLGEQIGTATPDEMTQVDIALRAALDL
jgi:mRNA-degrading endonuclease toxin of MazEF toxin-antitoxin module